MLSLLPPFVRGVIASLLLVLNTLFWCWLLFFVALVKLALPNTRVRVAVDRILNGIATRWVAGNSAWMSLTQRTQWNVAGFDDLPFRGWYLVNCNHQSWVDILVLQRVLNRRIPMLKFFLKRQLIYVPVIGLAWWALDFPFMRRHSDADLRRHPERRFDDIEATRRACEKFALVPTSVMNFAEGTRFTASKHRSQRSPYRRLLKPKAGALALAGDYARDPEYRKTFQRWLGDVWRDKDVRIDALLGAGARPDAPAMASGLDQAATAAAGRSPVSR